MIHKHQIHLKLKTDLDFRERRYKDEGLVNLLQGEYPDLRNISKEVLINAFKDYTSAERFRRMLLQEHKDLRGLDYCQKDEYELKEMSNLGYNVEIPNKEQLTLR